MDTPQDLSPSTVIVFDTNVLISSFVFPGFATLVYDYCALRFELFTSDWILNEFDEKLAHKFKRSSEQRKQIIDTIRERHTVVVPTSPLPTDSPDPDDNYVLQAALSVNADFLITGDEKHLLVLKKVGRTEIISPCTFYERFMY